MLSCHANWQISISLDGIQDIYNNLITIYPLVYFTECIKDLGNAPKPDRQQSGVVNNDRNLPLGKIA